MKFEYIVNISWYFSNDIKEINGEKTVLQTYKYVMYIVLYVYLLYRFM